MVSIRSDLARGPVKQPLVHLMPSSPDPNRNPALTLNRKPDTAKKPLAACAVIALLLVSPTSHAADITNLWERWFTAQTNLQSWTADFTQTRSLKVMSLPLVATGKVWVAVPGLFRWELGNPPQTIALRQPDQLLIIYPKLKQAEKYPLRDVPAGAVKDALSLLDASFPRDRATMEERFQLQSALETNATFQVTLQPRSASARKFINEVVIGFRTNDFSIASTQMSFSDGSLLRNDFTNTVLNSPIDSKTFEPTLPPDIRVVEPLRSGK